MQTLYGPLVATKLKRNDFYVDFFKNHFFRIIIYNTE